MGGASIWLEMHGVCMALQCRLEGGWGCESGLLRVLLNGETQGGGRLTWRRRAMLQAPGARNRSQSLQGEPPWARAAVPAALQSGHVADACEVEGWRVRWRGGCQA